MNMALSWVQRSVGISLRVGTYLLPVLHRTRKNKTYHASSSKADILRTARRDVRASLGNHNYFMCCTTGTYGHLYFSLPTLPVLLLRTANTLAVYDLLSDPSLHTLKCLQKLSVLAVQSQFTKRWKPFHYTGGAPFYCCVRWFVFRSRQQQGLSRVSCRIH